MSQSQLVTSTCWNLASAMAAFSLGFEGFPETSIRGSTDDDSSDEESDAGDVPTEFDMGKLPTIAKDDEIVKRKLEKAKRQPVRNDLSFIYSALLTSTPQTEDRGVLFIGRLPHGFFEDQLKAYFSQFGDVTRLRVSRNKKVNFEPDSILKDLTSHSFIIL